LISSTKHDKQQIKHSLLLSRIKKTSKPNGSAIRKPLHRNRTKSRGKLSTDLSILAEALPSESTSTSGVYAATSTSSKARTPILNGRSIRSKPGMQKRKAAISKFERDRFGKNMAAMISGTQNQGAGTESGIIRESVADEEILTADQVAQKAIPTLVENNPRAASWAALRRNIAQSIQA